MESIVHNPMVPYNTFINGGFHEGRFLRIQGTINQNAHSLKINLMCGPAVAHDDIALHLDFRFSEQVIVRNNKSHGNWGTEERHGPGFPLVRGEGFEVMILTEPRMYKIAVNGQHYTEFNQRVPIERISHIGIEGDIDLTIVQFNGGSNSSSGPSDTIASAPPPQFSNPHGYAPTGAAPYPPGGGSSWNGNNSVGFVAPPPLPNHSGPPAPGYQPGPGGYQTGPPPGQGYGPSPQYYPPGAGGPGPSYGPGPGYGPPQGQYDPQYGGYPPQGGYPQGPGGYPQGGYPSQGYPPGHSGGRGGGILGSAQKLLAGVGLAGVASKIPGMGGGSHGHGQGYPGGGYPGGGYPGGSHGGHGGGGGFPGGAAGGILGSAAALGIGGALASKMMKPKKMKKNKLLKYGLPLAGVGVGGYAVHKGMKGFRRGSWSGSSSSSSSD